MKFFLSLICIALCCVIKSQNLVPNPSFESFSSCPQSSGELELVVDDWFSFGVTPDFFHPCNNSIGSAVGVPNNYVGHQAALTGDGYVGLITYSSLDETTREFIACQLNQPLIPGELYNIRFAVALINGGALAGNYCTGNRIGVKLLNNPDYSIDNPLIASNEYDFQYEEFITDTATWTLINGSFIAEEEYNWLALGNFSTNSMTDTIHLSSNSQQTNCVSYLYLDDVCVSPDTKSCLLDLSLPESHAEIIPKIYPNPIKEYFIADFTRKVRYEISILGLHGQEILKEDGTSQKTVINCQTLNKGLYLVKIQVNGNLFLTKIIKS